MIVYNLLQILADAIGNKPNEETKSTPKTIRMGKYEADLQALKSISSLEPGSIIEMDLQELLKICPRDRKRTDAYRGLVTYLERQHITLIINSQKTKKNGKNNIN